MENNPGSIGQAIVDALSKRSSSTQPEATFVARTSGRSMGICFLRWASLNLAFFISGLAVFFYIFLFVLPTAEIEMGLILAGSALGALYFGLFHFPAVMMRLRLRVVLMGVEVEANRSMRIGRPTETLVADLAELRSLLLRYTRPSSKKETLEEYEQVEVQKRVDLLFGCINELMYSPWYAPRKMPGNAEMLSSQEDFSYSLIGDWAADLAVHLVSKRKWFRGSSYEFSTLKYFIDGPIKLFKAQYPMIYRQEKVNVDAFYAHLDRMRVDRRVWLIGLVTTIIITLVTVFLSRIFEVLMR